MAKARGPIRDGQAGIIAGDQPAGHNQQKSQCGNEYSESMMSGVIRGQNYSWESTNYFTLLFLKSRAEREIPILKAVCSLHWLLWSAI
jgi:hypothetical protein